MKIAKLLSRELNFFISLDNEIERPFGENGVAVDKPIKCQCCPHVETGQLICPANQLTGFYMSATLAFNGLTLLMTLTSLSIHPLKTSKNQIFSCFQGIYRYSRID